MARINKTPELLLVFPQTVGSFRGYSHHRQTTLKILDHLHVLRRKSENARLTVSGTLIAGFGLDVVVYIAIEPICGYRWSTRSPHLPSTSRRCHLVYSLPRSRYLTGYSSTYVSKSAELHCRHPAHKDKILQERVY